MSGYPIHPRATVLMDELTRLFQHMERPSAFWISTPIGEYESNNGSDWCKGCGVAIVRHLRRQDRKNRGDYLLDGGWRTEHDHLVFCAHCGKTLDGSLTDYGASQEVEALSYYGVKPGSSYDAMSLYEALNALEWSVDGTNLDLADAACDLAEALLWCAT